MYTSSVHRLGCQPSGRQQGALYFSICTLYRCWGVSVQCGTWWPSNGFSASVLPVFRPERFRCNAACGRVNGFNASALPLFRLKLFRLKQCRCTCLNAKLMCVKPRVMTRHVNSIKIQQAGAVTSPSAVTAPHPHDRQARSPTTWVPYPRASRVNHRQMHCCSTRPTVVPRRAH